MWSWHVGLLAQLRGLPVGSYVLEGPPGSGKQALVDAWVPHCIDRYVESAGEAARWGVEESRAVHSFLSTAPAFLDAKMVVLPADRMTLSACQALLKIVEDCVIPVRFIWLSRDFHALPVTIRSRSQCYRLPIPPESAYRAWLAEAVSSATEAALMLAMHLYPGSPEQARLWLLDPQGPARAEALFAQLDSLIAGSAKPLERVPAIRELEEHWALSRLWLAQILAVEAPIPVRQWPVLAGPARVQGVAWWETHVRLRRLQHVTPGAHAGLLWHQLLYTIKESVCL